MTNLTPAGVIHGDSPLLQVSYMEILDSSRSHTLQESCIEILDLCRSHTYNDILDSCRNHTWRYLTPAGDIHIDILDMHRYLTHAGVIHHDILDSCKSHAS